MGFVFNGTRMEVKVAQTDKQWYVVHAFSGMEKTVLKNLEERIKQAGMADSFGRILVPVEEVVEIRKGQKSISERRFFPGYVLVEMEMNEQTWHLVKNSNKVTGFVGGNLVAKLYHCGATIFGLSRNKNPVCYLNQEGYNDKIQLIKIYVVMLINEY